ncbi:MAG: fasciclin domain-containing protein [Phenylobacterium sp.]|uniref:fasciclin domain-containing protein n=1 Tax=Phenylobacterium sp. TaxID=1871053 RepID=UPI002722F409|nr:fasciclin domain-containing protein [Phenylobacterium sp.]MDO8901883.1 fasciclin domain-containing protein [Phenylobacterium sp.]MDP2212704.1 fasciclin domain-containing protein [Phenylobacterium sp.]
MTDPKFRILAGASALVLALTLSACSQPQDTAAAPEAEPMAAAEPAMAQTNIVAGAQASPDHTTLVAAVQAADLVDTLSGPGPFTVFAPTNAAFEKLPAGTVDSLLQPAAKDQLTSVLTYHVVAGELMAADVLAAIEAGGGTATLTTVQGGELKASVVNGAVQLTDAQGNTSMVTATDLDQSNGVIHVIDTVIMPAA